MNLPGDATETQATARMIRVDHAGEYGATRIYSGQLAVLGHGPSGDTLRHMLAQEQAHLEKFTALVKERHVRPTALMPLWHIAGFALGAVTAAFGEKAAMACTVAVEDAIDAHYRAQSEELADREPALKSTIEEFRAEELEHRDTALALGAEQTPGYRLLYGAIRAGCQVAIKLSERV
jgi:3-demethoxyubiquinol 3-hydroxylase